MPHPTYFTQTPPNVLHYGPLFLPSIPLSPGILLLPGVLVPIPLVSLSLPSVPRLATSVPLSPGGAGLAVAMTLSAFWSHAPWLNPVVGAPVHMRAPATEGAPASSGHGYSRQSSWNQSHQGQS